MIELPQNFDSIFRYIVVVSQRAEQLINGAKPRAESQFKKPTLEARDDVDAGLVPWRVLTQEEIDAQRQAIVDQFRAEVAGEGFDPEGGPAIPDVLPTGGEAVEVPAGDDDRDDELARLQKLLGMVGPAALRADDEDDEDGGDDEPVEEVSLETEVDLEPDDDDEEED